jgi:hypothetical protein
MATEAPSLQKTTLTANLREPQRWVAFAVGNSVAPYEGLLAPSAYQHRSRSGTRSC